MTLFKLIFEHDMVLEPVGNLKSTKEPSTLDDFLKPIQTYSRFYLSATDLIQQKFGLTASDHYSQVMNALHESLQAKSLLGSDGKVFDNIVDSFESMEDGGAIIISFDDVALTPFPILKTNESFRDKIEELTTILNKGQLVLFKVKAHHGFDVHLFSRDNLYRSLFYNIKPLISDNFRFFSINGKRAKSERLFYFETWSLSRPPHGFEEVFEDTAFY